MNQHERLRRVSIALACFLGVPITQAASWDWNNGTAPWSDTTAWTPNAVPSSANDTILRFGGVGDTPYTSTNDLAGSFLLRQLQLNSSATVAETIVASAGGILSFVSDGVANPEITQNGTGAFAINLGIEAANPLTFGGTGTGLVTLGGPITGVGGLTFASGNWRFVDVTSTFTGGVTIGSGAVLELAPAGPINIAPAASSIIGSNAGANPLTINGGTLKFTTTGNITFGDNRPLTFGPNGGILDLRNSGTVGGGNIVNSGTNDLALTLNNTGANLAVIKFNGGQNGISTNTTNNGDWSSNNNTLRIQSYAGTGGLRIELENGAMFQNRSATVGVPLTVRGVPGGDPTSGPNALVNANLSLTTGRMIFDITGTHNFSQGLILEEAMQLSAAGASRAIDGNVVVATGAYVAFNGRGTGTALGPNIIAAGTNTNPGQHPLYVGVGGNDTLTIQSGAIAVFDSRIRHEQANSNAVLLNARAIISAGAELRLAQSLSRATAVLAGAAGQINTNTTTAVAAHHIIDGDIQGQGTSASESLLSIYLPAAGGTDSNFDQVPDTDSFVDLGGVVFRNNTTTTSGGTNGTDLVINGSGFGGLRVEGRARPNALFDSGGAVSDPVSTADKVANLLTASRLAGLTGTGGYLTPAPIGNPFAFPAGGEWGLGVPVGLKVTDHNSAGVDVSLAALGGFSHSIAVTAGATLDLGVTSPFVIGNAARVEGSGAIISSGSVTVDVGSVVAPGLGDIGTLAVTTGTLTLSGGLSIGVQNTLADVLAVTGNLALGGELSLGGSFGTQDLILASYTGNLTGTFSSISGLSPLFSINYGTGANSVIKLVFDTSPTLVWEGLPAATWSVGGGNWKAGGIFADGNRVKFDDTAGGSTTVTITGSDVKPADVTVDADTKNYTIISSAGAALAGAGELTKAGAMILTLIGPATYAGGTSIDEGTLALGSANALPDVGLITVAAGATLNTQGNNDTVGDLTVAGSVTGGGTLAVNALTLSGSGTFAPSLVSNVSISKVGGPGALAVPIDFNTGIREINVAAASTFTLTGTLSNGGFDKTGVGDLVLAPLVANQHMGGTGVSGGKLIAQLGAIPANSPLTVNSGGTLELAPAQPLVLSSLSGTGGTITGANGITLNQTTTTTFAGSITGVTSVTMNGAGQITLTGASNYSGGLFANAGRVILTAPTAGGAGIVSVNPGGKLGSGAALASRVDLLGGTFFGFGGPASVASNDLVAGAGTTTTVSLSDPDNPGTRSEMIVLGTLKGSGNLNAVISTNAPHPDGGVGLRLRGTGASDFSGTITAGQSVKLEVQTGQAGPFSPAGTGKFVFTGGTFTGGLNGDYSQFNIRNNFAGNTVLGNNVEVVGTGFANMNMAGGAGNIVDAVTTMGNLRIGGQTLGVNKNGGVAQTLEFTSVTLTGGNPTFSPTTPGFGASGTSNLRLGPISELAPNTGIILDGQTTLTLAAANSYTGATVVQNGTLRFGAAGALPEAGALVVNGGTVDLAGGFAGFNQTTSSLTGTGGTITNSDVAAARVFTVAQATDTTFGGSVSGNLSFRKTGAGTLTLSGVVSSSDVVSVEGGTLKVTGIVFPTTVVSGGGNVSGTGTLGTVNVNNGGLLTPGDFAALPNPAGVLNATDVTFVLGSAMDVALAKATAGAPPVAADYASLRITGAINLGNADLDLSLGSGIEQNDLFTIILNDGPSAVTGTFFDLANGATFSTTGQFFRISYFDDASTPGIFELAGGNDVSLLAVPEPGSAVLLLGGLALLAGRRRRSSGMGL
jgi:fibronectin-binding autotransporter adhesin